MPKHHAFPARGTSRVTCLLLSHGRIISASEDHSIRIYSPATGELLQSLDGHGGGVWALAATKETVVSGSADRTVRIWDPTTGRCMHVFAGHTSTVRCLAIVEPEWVEEKGEGGREKWPKQTVIVTGSRDRSLRVWKLPRPGEAEYRWGNKGFVPSEEDIKANPYHELYLVGHGEEVRALAARGRTLASGSYDCTVREWDIVTGDCKLALVGHTQRVYSVVLSPDRDSIYSGSMDGMIRIWNVNDGQCRHTLTGHESMIGLLGLSPSFLVSASVDTTLRVWDPDTGELRHTLAGHADAVICFQHDDVRVVSGEKGALKVWNVRDGTVVRDLLTGVEGVCEVVFEGRLCVAARSRDKATMIDVRDFDDDESGWFGEVLAGATDSHTSRVESTV